jgi:hypothetical protein
MRFLIVDTDELRDDSPPSMGEYFSLEVRMAC